VSVSYPDEVTVFDPNFANVHGTYNGSRFCDNDQYSHKENG